MGGRWGELGRKRALAHVFVLALGKAEKGGEVRLYSSLKPVRFVLFAVLEMDPTAGRLEHVSGHKQGTFLQRKRV